MTQDTPQPVKKRSTKGYVLLGFVIAGAVALLSWTRTWVDVHFIMPTGAPRDLEVVGSTASPALTALALCLLALAAALAIAGRIFRIILSVIGLALGGGIIASAVRAMSDPIAAAEPAITTASGVGGHDAVRALVETATLTPWPVVSLIAGVFAILVSLVALLTSSRWAGGSRRYSTGSKPVVVQDRPRDAVDNWDDLSRGEDPTEGDAR